jgi:hypothetical protein
VHTKPAHRDEAIRIAAIFRANIVDSSATTYTIEITGDTEKVEGDDQYAQASRYQRIDPHWAHRDLPRNHPHRISPA